MKIHRLPMTREEIIAATSKVQVEPDRANVKALEKHLQEQYWKAQAALAERLAAMVLQVFEQGKIPANQLYGPVNLIRQMTHTNPSTLDQLMQEYYKSWPEEEVERFKASGVREQSW